MGYFHKRKIFILITRFFPLLLVCIFPLTVFAQDDSTSARLGTIRGVILEERSQQPVPRVRITIKGKKLGAISAENGEYRIEKVPVGHYLLTASANGYTTASQEIVVGSARQAIVDFELRESLHEGDSIVVTANRALAPINRVAAVSVTPFSIEDVNRHAAAFQDPSRMAQNFAGVYGRGTTNNYIIVRGGSPMELLWRLDGIDILNPNHFGKNGSSGGLVSAFSSQMLGNSDFMTGAFPAEYGTKMSAVFDLHTRNGNTEEYEGTAEISFNGMQVLVEGPMPGLDASSFILNYRHSTIAVLRDLGIIDGDAMPDFDDAMIKSRLRLGATDQIDITGLWGYATLESDNTDGEEIGAGSKILLGGVDWQHIFSDGLISHLKINKTRNSFKDGINNSGYPEEITIGFTTVEARLSYVPNAITGIDVGVVYQPGTYSIENYDGLFFADTSITIDGYRAFANWNWHIMPELVWNAGLFTQVIDRNNRVSHEPRLSLAWTPLEEHTISAAFGIHRQPQPIGLNFEFSEALHYVLGYTYRPYEDLMIKLEGYVKEYDDIPIHASTKDSYSFLNEGYAGRIDFSDLVPNGTGKSYGAELTLLKHYESGYYITATASYVRQQFQGSDGITHFGTFDNIYILNALSGYDIKLSESTTLTLSEKFTIAGGGMYTPFDMAASRDAGYGIYDSTRAFGVRAEPYYRLDINAEFRINWSSSGLVIFLSVLNALNTENIVYRFYRYPDEIRGENDLPIIPVLGIRYEF